MKIFCSGIGGIGLSAYAAYQQREGHHVLGSDHVDSAILQDLRSQGVEIFLEQDGSHVPTGVDLFVYSEAIPPGSPERRRAAELGIPEQSYFQALGDLTRPFRVVAIAGTHGKSSTTVMAVRVLMDAGLDPSVIVGTKTRELGDRNWRRGGSDLFVVEACEYRRSFHSLSPRVILLTNADGDHFDYYRSQEEYEQAFVDFVKRLSPDGLVITHGNDPLCTSITERGGRRVMDADLLSLPALSTPGVHMQQNAQLVLALARELGIREEQARASLAGYAGCWRRMEVRGTWDDGVTVIDDYGHHPVEVRATIQALLQAYPRRRLVVVFQPHTHDRTLKLYGDFARAFAGAAVVIVPNIYDARRERDSGIVDRGQFVRDIGEGSRVEAFDGSSLCETEHLLKESVLRPNDILLVMGAGDVTELAGRMAQG